MSDKRKYAISGAVSRQYHIQVVEKLELEIKSLKAELVTSRAECVRLEGEITALKSSAKGVRSRCLLLESDLTAARAAHEQTNAVLADEHSRLRNLQSLIERERAAHEAEMRRVREVCARAARGAS